MPLEKEGTTMSVDAHGVMRAFVKAADARRDHRTEPVRKPTIAISRCMGSGGDAIARAVADRLELDVYGREILDAVAEQAKVDRGLMSSLNEMAETPRDAWLYSALFGKSVSRDDYLYHLATTVRGLHRLGGVIMGRGANIILEGRDVLRVRITGSVEACARRVAEEDGIDIGAAKRKVKESKRKRGRFTWEMFHRRINDPDNFDLVINTDRLAETAVAADIIIAMVRALDLDRPALAAD